MVPEHLASFVIFEAGSETKVESVVSNKAPLNENVEHAMIRVVELISNLAE